MINTQSLMTLSEKDKKHVWHPFTSFGTTSPNLPIHNAKGVNAKILFTLTQNLLKNS